MFQRKVQAKSRHFLVKTTLIDRSSSAYIRCSSFTITPRAACFGHDVPLSTDAPIRHHILATERLGDISLTTESCRHSSSTGKVTESVTRKGDLPAYERRDGFMLTSCNMPKRKTPCLQMLARVLQVGTNSAYSCSAQLGVPECDQNGLNHPPHECAACKLPPVQT